MRKARLLPRFNLFILIVLISGFVLLEVIYHHGIFRFLIYFFLMIVLLSLLWALSLFRGLSLRLLNSRQWVQSGEWLIQNYELAQNSFFPALWLELEDFSAYKLKSYSEIYGINGREVRRWQRKILTKGRGLFNIGPLRLKTSDLFSLFRIEVQILEQGQLLVLPAEPRLDFPIVKQAGSGREGLFLSREKLAGVLSCGVREYQYGDNLRWVHWPSSVKTGKLMVRSFEKSQRQQWFILLDFSLQNLDSAPKEAAEDLILLTSSLLRYASLLKIEYALRIFDAQEQKLGTGLGRSQSLQALKQLALAQPGKGDFSAFLEKELKSGQGLKTFFVIGMAANQYHSIIKNRHSIKQGHIFSLDYSGKLTPAFSINNQGTFCFWPVQLLHSNLVKSHKTAREDIHEKT